MTATRVIAYAPNGASQGPLPTPQDLQVGYPLNDVGALTLNYPPDAPRSDLLGKPVELAVEVSWDKGLTWSEPASSRFLYLRDGRDPIKTGDAYAVEAAAYVIRMQKALVGFTGLNAENVRQFTNASPGAILRALWDEAVARGALAGMTLAVTTTQDTSGVPWPVSANQTIAYEPGKDLLSILQEMADAGLVDYRTQGRTVQVYVQEDTAGMGADRTLGGSPVTLRFGRDLTEAPFRRTWEGLADTAMVMGDNAATLTRTNVAAIKPWGRWETYVTASGVGDTGTLTTIADAALTLTEKERTEHTFGLDFSAAVHLPFRDYAPGEWVYAATDGSGVQRMRVRQVTLTKDANGAVGGNVVLNDRFLEADVLTSRRIQKIITGATQAGTGGQPGGTGADILQPAQVMGLNATSTAYVQDDGRVQAQISLDWTDVTTNADGTPITDLDHYEVWSRPVGAGPWAMVALADLSSWSNSPYDPRANWEFKVRAVDTVFNRGAFSAIDSVTTAHDTVGPVAPSAPTATTRLGVGRVSWNGLSNVGGAMDADFAYVAVHVDTVNNFTPTTANRIGELGAAGYAVTGPLNYAATYYAKLVAYDTSGNASAASAQVTLTVAALVDVSNFPDDAMTTLYARTGHFIDLTADNFSANLIEGMWVKAGTLEASRLSISARAPSVLPNAFMEEADGTGKPVYWTTWYDTNALSGVTPGISGGRSLRVTLASGQQASVGNTSDTWHPVVGGQKFAIRGLFRPSVTMSATSVRLRFCTSAGASQPWGIFDSNVVWQDIVGTGTWNAGQTYELAATFTVPAGHTQMGLSFFAPNIGAAYVMDVDGLEVFPAVGDGQITEVGAGKIKTGVVQATERIVAGTLFGARAELNGATGFQAYDGAGVLTFEVRASDGNVFTAGTFTTKAGAGSGRVEISAANNPYQSGQTWATLAFHSNNSAWDPGLLWAVYGTTSGTNWGNLSIRGPKLGTRQPAALDLRSEEQTNLTAIYLTANRIYTSAEVHEFGDPGVDILTFRQRYSGSSTAQGWSFQSPGMKRIDFLFGTLGQNTIVSKDESAALMRLNLYATTIHFLSSASGGDLEVAPASSMSNRIGLGSDDANNKLTFGAGTPGNLRATNSAGSAYVPMAASAFPVNSDVRHKRNLRRTRDADRALKMARKDARIAKPAGAGSMSILDKVRALGVYDYETPNGMSHGVHHAMPAEGFTQRGVIAQEVQEFWPEAVYDDGEETGLGVDLYYLLSTVVAAFQELADEVDTLKANQSPTP